MFALASASAGCAGVWGFDDLVVGDAGGSSGTDATIPGDGASGSDSGADGLADGPMIQCDGGLTACGPSCIDTHGDPKNCGACGHDCQGGQCQQGACQPVVIASGFMGTTDAGGTIAPTYIAVDANDVYWLVDNTGVMKCSTSG